MFQSCFKIATHAASTSPRFLYPVLLSCSISSMVRGVSLYVLLMILSVSLTDTFSGLGMRISSSVATCNIRPSEPYSGAIFSMSLTTLLATLYDLAMVAGISPRLPRLALRVPVFAMLDSFYLPILVLLMRFMVPLNV
jgi:hypothetical protein